MRGVELASQGIELFLRVEFQGREKAPEASDSTRSSCDELPTSHQQGPSLCPIAREMLLTMSIGIHKEISVCPPARSSEPAGGNSRRARFRTRSSTKRARSNCQRMSETRGWVITRLLSRRRPHRVIYRLQHHNNTRNSPARLQLYARVWRRWDNHSQSTRS